MNIRQRDFDIRQIADSGQIFRLCRWEQDTYRLTAKDRYLEIRQQEDELELSCSRQEFEDIWSRYFDLDMDYGRIKSQIDPADTYLTAAASYGGGIRILRQDPWEMLVTFLISQQNNIPRIRKCIEELCRRFGPEKHNFRGERYYGFPAPETLAEAGEEGMCVCNLGYRNKYIARCAKMVAEGSFSLEKLNKKSYRETKDKLKELYGVGTKVADCICLFGYHHIEAFPVDTHIQAVIENHYPDGFPLERYEGYAGILQQYLFYYDLSHPEG